MRISELSTDIAFDVMCKLNAYTNNIIQDKKVIAEFKRKLDVDETETTLSQRLAILVEKVPVIVPLLLGDHKNDVCGIIAAINDKSIDEIKNQNILVTMQQVKEAVQDKDLIDFFKSCMDTAGGE